jgi:hypothetical protein
MKRTITIVLLCVIAATVICALVLPRYLGTFYDREGVPSALISLHEVLLRHIKVHGYAPQSFEDLMPFISEEWYGSRCDIVRSGEDGYLLTISSPARTVVIRINYVVSQEGQVEEYNAFIVDSH